MKPNGTLILILVVAMAVATGIAWTETGDRPVCTGDGPHGPHGMTGLEEHPGCTGDGPHGPRGMMGRHHSPARMAEALGLTDDQREAVRELLSADRESVHQRMETGMQEILTPEQWEKFQEIKTRRDERCEAREAREPRGPRGRKGRMGAGRGTPDGMLDHRLERMTGNLDLTAEQEDRIRQIFEEAAPPSREEMHSRIAAVLTSEQQEKMEQRRSRRPGMGRTEGKGRTQRSRRPGTGLQRRLPEELDLTDEQRQAVHEMMRSIHGEQRELTRSRIEELLTPEQREKLEQIHAEDTTAEE